MAEERLDIVVAAKDAATANLKKAKDSVRAISEEVNRTTKATSVWQTEIGRIPSSVKWAAGIAVGAITVLAKKSIDAYAEAERATNRLYHLTEQTVGATREQTDALVAQAEALQKIGVVEDDTVKFGQSQLATFALQTATIGKLTPSMMDLAVAVDGVNVSQQSMINVGNLVGKAMTGQASALSRYGVTMTEAQRKIIETGTESERAATLVDVLSQNFGGLNESMRKTAEGGMKSLDIRTADLMENIGKGLTPVFINAKTGVVELGEAMFGTEGSSKVAFNAFRNVTEMVAVLANKATKAYAAIGSLNANLKYLKPTNIKDQLLNKMTFGLMGKDAYGEINDELVKFGGIANSADDALEKFLWRNIEAEQSFDRMAKAAGGAGDEIPKDLDNIGDGAKDAASAIRALLGEFKSLEAKMSDLKRQAEDERTKGALAGLDARQRAAALYVEQEQKVLDLQEKINEAEGKVTMREMNELLAEKAAAFAEVQANMMIPMTMPAEYAEAVRRSKMTEFGRSMEDVRIGETSRQIEYGGRMAEIETEAKATRQQIFNFTFNGDVNDKEALKKDVIEAINRQSALAAAGA